MKLRNSQLTLFAVCFLALITFITSCSSDKEGYRVTDTGLHYRVITSQNGEKPELGDVMIMHIAYYTNTDSLLYDSGKVNDSFPVKLVAPTFRGGVEEGFAMMGAGDSALFKVPADSLFNKTFMYETPAYIQKESMIYFRVKMKHIYKREYLDSLKSAHDLERRKLEFEKIEGFLKENNMDVMPTENGAYLSVVKPGTGPNSEPGDSVFVLYTGKLIDGTVFDQSENPAAPFGFVTGQGAVIAGWEECIPLLNKGAVARLVIPSDLAYGGEDYGAIPPYSTLVFEVRILDIKKKKNP